MNELIYNSKHSRDFGIYISGSGTFNSPERDAETISIPGKNGDLEVSHNRFKNIAVEYPAFIVSKFKDNAAAARAWLLAASGYHRLEDTYHSEYFRLGRFTGPLDFDMKFLNRAGEFKLQFDCKPQRFLKSGEEVLMFTAAGSIYNSTEFTALPLIRVYGTAAGTLTIGNTIVQINAISEYVDLDCELQDAFKGSTNCNGNVYAPNFPALSPGGTGISFSGGITKLEIKPRWWTV